MSTKVEKHHSNRREGIPGNTNEQIFVLKYSFLQYVSTLKNQMHMCKDRRYITPSYTILILSGQISFTLRYVLDKDRDLLSLIACGQNYQTNCVLYLICSLQIQITAVLPALSLIVHQDLSAEQIRASTDDDAIKVETEKHLKDNTFYDYDDLRRLFYHHSFRFSFPLPSS